MNRIFGTFDLGSILGIDGQRCMRDAWVANFAINFFVKSNVNLELVIQGSGALATSKTFLME